MYLRAFKPLIQNSKAVCRFSGEGAVTNIEEYPKPIAPAIVRPREADLPYISQIQFITTRPRDAVSETVV